MCINVGTGIWLHVNMYVYYDVIGIVSIVRTQDMLLWFTCNNFHLIECNFRRRLNAPLIDLQLSFVTCVVNLLYLVIIYLLFAFIFEQTILLQKASISSEV